MGEGEYKVTDRRPIGARQWGWSQRTAKRMARQGFSPNGISVAGMICGLFGGVCFALTAQFPEWQRLLWLGAAACMQLRLLANMFDGMVAIESGKASAVGELFNEVPDRVSDTAILIGAGYALGGNVVLGYAAACAAMFTAYVRTTGKAAGAPHFFSGPMAKQHRMALLTVCTIFLAILPAYAMHWSVLQVALGLITALGLVTGLRRLRQIATYLRLSHG